jgi:hypothetical protein
MAMVATSAPMTPATWYPMRATMMTFGPGVTCAIANMSVNCRAVIQPSTSTAMRCISGTAELAPPMANSDIRAK